MLKIQMSVRRFAVNERVTLRLHDKVFTVAAASAPDTYVITAGFGETLSDVPGALLQPAEAEIVNLARRVA